MLNLKNIDPAIRKMKEKNITQGYIKQSVDTAIKKDEREEYGHNSTLKKV